MSHPISLGNKINQTEINSIINNFSKIILEAVNRIIGKPKLIRKRSQSHYRIQYSYKNIHKISKYILKTQIH